MGTDGDVSILFEALLLRFCTSHRGEARSNRVRALISVDESVATTLPLDDYPQPQVLTLEAKSAEIEMVAENKQGQWLGAFLSTAEAKAKKDRRFS